MIRRLYVHNFRCLENFELSLAGQSSVLLIGKNGSGKTAVGGALEVLRKIARGESHAGDLISAGDVAFGGFDIPVRFEIEAELDGTVYEYAVAFYPPDESTELHIVEEKFVAGGTPVYTREQAEVRLAKNGAGFLMDRHLVAFPIIQAQLDEPLFKFKQWLSRALILRPIPALIGGESRHETLTPNPDLRDLEPGFPAF